MGNIDGVSRSAWMSSPAGRSPRASLIRACTSCSAYSMSVRGANVTVISLAPRIERECTRDTPGTTLIASSIGRVTLNTTCRAPSEEPRATIVMRGNVSSG